MYRKIKVAAYCRVSTDVFDKAQAQIYERGKMSREGRKYSKHYWFSSKVFCGKCGYTYNISGRTSNTKRTLRCVNRGKYGSNHRIDKNGAEVGCDNKGVNEKVLEACMKHILEYVQCSREKIIKGLYEDIEYIRQIESPADPEPIKGEIENYNIKKRKAIDLMIDGLITKEDLRKLTEYYDSEITKLTEQLAASQNTNVLVQEQISTIKEYVASVNRTSSADICSTEVYGEMLKRIVVQENQTIDFYLNCIPFGFRLRYHVKKFNQQHRFNIFIDNCEVIE